MHLNFRIALSMTVSCSVAATFKSYSDRNGLLIANSQILSLTYALRVVAKKGRLHRLYESHFYAFTNDVLEKV